MLRPHLPSLPDERVTEDQARFILIVRAAAELNVVRGGCASRRVRFDMMEFKERGFAASAFASDERTASLIPLPDRTPDGRPYVTPGRRTFIRAQSR